MCRGDIPQTFCGVKHCLPPVRATDRRLNSRHIHQQGDLRNSFNSVYSGYTSPLTLSIVLWCYASIRGAPLCNNSLHFQDKCINSNQRYFFNPVSLSACLHLLLTCLSCLSMQLSSLPSPGLTSAQYFFRSTLHSLAACFRAATACSSRDAAS